MKMPCSILILVLLTAVSFAPAMSADAQPELDLSDRASIVAYFLDEVSRALETVIEIISPEGEDPSIAAESSGPAEEPTPESYPLAEPVG